MKFSPQRITIENFRGIRRSKTIDFTGVQPGLYFVRGRNDVGERLGSNGAGKSTFFIEAVSWALTGKLSRTNRPGADVVNRAAPKELTSVQFDFLLGNEAHTIIRTRNPNNLQLDGEKVEQGAVDRLLPLSDLALRRSLFIDQFNGMFLDLKPEDKARIFSETLGLDTWVQASDKAGAAMTEFENQRDRISRRYEAANAVIDEIAVRLKEAKQREDEFEDEIVEKIKAAKVRRTAAEKEMAQAARELDKARAANGKVTDVDKVRRLDTFINMRRAQAATFAEREGTVQSCEREITRLEKQLERYKEGTRTCPECGQRVTASHIEEQREKVELDIKRVRRELADTETILTEGRKVFAKLLQDIEALEASMVDAKAAQAIVEARAEASLTATKMFHAAKREVKELNEADNPHTKQVDELKQTLADKKDEAEKLGEKVDEFDSKIEIYKFWQRGFREIRLHQIDTTLAELELATNRDAEELGLDDWNISFATERETKAGSISTGFNVFLYPPGETEPLSWESYSGGESQRWQLATTFGLAEVLLMRAGIDTDFEILDEPTHHLSQPEGIDDLLSCLRERAARLGRRIFVIDQLALERGSFDGVVTVVKDKKQGTYVEDSGLGAILLAAPAAEPFGLEDEVPRHRKLERVQL